VAIKVPLWVGRPRVYLFRARAFHLRFSILLMKPVSSTPSTQPQTTKTTITTTRYPKQNDGEDEQWDKSGSTRLSGPLHPDTAIRVRLLKGPMPQNLSLICKCKTDHCAVGLQTDGTMSNKAVRYYSEKSSSIFFQMFGPLIAYRYRLSIFW
jgi:hypothetical protein